MNTNLDWTSTLTVLRDQGVAAILISYAGSGDEGSIEHVGYMSEANTHRDDDDSIDTSQYEPWSHMEDIKPTDQSKFDEFLKSEAYNLLEHVEDWYNNDGGQGVIAIDTKNGKWYCLNQVNTMSTEDYTHSGKVKA